ncbi:MAG: proton extrusion protein PcxA [Cyanobacteria bacterium P01_D01_bin.105]
MTNSSQRFGLFGIIRRWFTRTPERALDQAYEAALKIRQLEDTHFDGNPITESYGNLSPSAYRLLQKELNKNLSIIRRRMAEFRASDAFYPVAAVDDQMISRASSSAAGSSAAGSSAEDGALVGPMNTPLPDDLPIDQINGPAIIFTKLQLIDAVLERYRRSSIFALSAFGPDQSSSRQRLSGSSIEPVVGVPVPGDSANEALSNRTNVLPRSILRTVDRVKQDLDPDAEVDVVRNFRNSKNQTTIAITFVLQLIIIPLLAQYLSKNFIVGPIVEQGRDYTQADVFLNEEMEEDALHELQRYEERLRFEVLIGTVPKIEEVEIETRVRRKASEIEDEYRQRSADAVKNVFADVIAVVTFSLLLSGCKEKVATLKSFIDEIIYGLSDSAKAFIIILFTDIFVGFHSPHGWEILLESLSNHLGLASNRNFIFLFIATFPVILDTVFKYWIFRYLNRISPSAVATYKNMNE